MPCRVIRVDDKPYLERYYVGETARKAQLWLHRFLAADQDRFFHSHPWYAQSILITGGYTEETLFFPNGKIQDVAGQAHQTKIARFVAGDTNIINPSTLHKLTQIDKDTWTILTVNHGWSDWHFINEAGEVIQMGKTHGYDWFKNYLSRNEYADHKRD